MRRWALKGALRRNGDENDENGHRLEEGKLREERGEKV